MNHAFLTFTMNEAWEYLHHLLSSLSDQVVSSGFRKTGYHVVGSFTG
jgi:hypothetical protein